MSGSRCSYLPLQTHHSSGARKLPGATTANIIVATLNETRKGGALDLDRIAQRAGSTAEITSQVLDELVGVGHTSREQLSPQTRFRLASEGIRLGVMDRVAGTFTWQEFEAFCQDCLISFDFAVKKGMIFSDESRRWQIDVLGTRDEIILAFDCKHWKSPNYLSRFKKAAEHQRLALKAFLRYQRKEENSRRDAWALPVILTLFDPRVRTLDEVVLVSIGQLSDFLAHVAKYEPELPFLSG